MEPSGSSTAPGKGIVLACSGSGFSSIGSNSPSTTGDLGTEVFSGSISSGFGRSSIDNIAGNTNLSLVSMALTRIASASICSAFIFLAAARFAIVPTNDLEALTLSSFFLPKNDLTNEKPNLGSAVTAWKPALIFLNGAVIADFKLAATILA